MISGAARSQTELNERRSLQTTSTTLRWFSQREISAIAPNYGLDTRRQCRRQFEKPDTSTRYGEVSG